MRISLIAFTLALAMATPAAFAATPQFAAAHAPTADDATPLIGEIRVTLNSDYPRVTVGGEEWSAVVYERNGTVAIIRNLPLSDAPFVLDFEPTRDGLSPGSITVELKDFKRKRVKREYHMVAKKKLKFAKQKEAAPEPTEPTEPAPDEKPDAPKPNPETDENDL